MFKVSRMRHLLADLIAICFSVY